MRFRGWLAASVLASSSVSGLCAQADAELQRVRDLVRAGALPRNALVEAESRHLERRYRETLRRTLLSDSLDPLEIETMLDAANGLQRIVQERFDRVQAQVNAQVVPVNRLQEAKDQLDAARRQTELAESRANLVRQMTRMAAAETYLEELEGDEEAYRFYGFEEYEQELLYEIGEMYRAAFGSEPPISAEGDTLLHRSMGLDHTGRIDVAVHPDSDEGLFLIYMLENLGIPYIAFRTAIPGQATGPHIHLGPPSDPIDPEASQLPD